MCFEWDERYRREEAIRLSKEKADEFMKRTREAAQADSAGKPEHKPAEKQEEVAA